MKFYTSIALCMFFVYCSKAQALVDIEYYLKNKQIPVVARKYYQAGFVSDERTASQIIDSVKTRNNSTRPFYLLLVSKMQIQIDGDLAERLDMLCENAYENNPDAIIEFLYCKNSLVKNSFKESWANAIAGEIMISHEKNEEHYLESIRLGTLKKSKPQNKKNLLAFHSVIDRQLHLRLSYSQ